jgi:hypothetical protein
MNPNLIVPEVFEIFYGDAKVFPFKAVYQGTFQPLDLSNCVNIELMLPLSSGGGYTQLMLNAGQVSIVGNPILGQGAAPISSVVSPTLQTGTLQDVFAIYTIASGTPVNISGGLTVGIVYAITSLGNTTALQWQALGLPVGVTPVIGVTFVCTSVTPGVGTGVVQTLVPNSPLTVPFRKCFSVFE